MAIIVWKPAEWVAPKSPSKVAISSNIETRMVASLLLPGYVSGYRSFEGRELIIA